MGCIFDDCREIINMAFTFFEGKIIEDCLFTKCRKIMDVGNNTAIKNCQFVSCKAHLIKAGKNCKISSCEFIDVCVEEKYEKWNNNGSAIICTVAEDYALSCIENCEFNGVKAGNGFLIAVDSYKHVKPGIATVSDCVLSNCSTQRESGCVIKTKYTYYGFFNKEKEEIGLFATNLKGFNNIPKKGGECVNYKVKEKDIYGKKIGASENVEIGVSGKITNYLYQEELYF